MPFHRALRYEGGIQGCCSVEKAAREAAATGTQRKKKTTPICTSDYVQVRCFMITKELNDKKNGLSPAQFDYE